MELAKGEARPLAGLSADLWEFFDPVDPEAAIGPLAELGLDRGVENAPRDFYRQLQRIVALNGVAGHSWRRVEGASRTRTRARPGE